MNKINLSASLVAVLALVSNSTFAGQQSENYYYTYADVIAVEPAISTERVTTPHRECTTEPVRYERARENHYERQTLPSLIGGLIGGVIGNQFGKGRGKTAMTIVGAFSGARIAANSNRSHHRNHPDANHYRKTVQREHCKTVHTVETVERVNGYQVTYQYLGREFVKTTGVHPGEQVRIRVELSPVVDESDAAYARL